MLCLQVFFVNLGYHDGTTRIFYSKIIAISTKKFNLYNSYNGEWIFLNCTTKSTLQKSRNTKNQRLDVERFLDFGLMALAIYDASSQKCLFHSLHSHQILLIMTFGS